MRRLVFGLVVLAACGTARRSTATAAAGIADAAHPACVPARREGRPRAARSDQFGLDDQARHRTDRHRHRPRRAREAAVLAPRHQGRVRSRRRRRRPTRRRRTAGRRRRAGPGPHKFRVTVDPAVPPGTYDVRFVGKWGVSNPRAFVVGDLNEVEREGTEQRRAGGAAGRDRHHGQRRDRDADRRRLHGLRRQEGPARAASRAWRRRSTAAPARWSRSTTSSAASSATNRNYRDNDALADVILPADGDYFVRLVAVRLPGRRAGLLLPAHDLDRPVDRRRVPARDRAGEADAGHALRPQPAQRPARRWLHGRWPAAREAHRHDHAADRRRGASSRSAAASTPAPRFRTASSTSSRARTARRTRCRSTSPATSSS